MFAIKLELTQKTYSNGSPRQTKIKWHETRGKGASVMIDFQRKNLNYFGISFGLHYLCNQDGERRDILCDSTDTHGGV